MDTLRDKIVTTRKKQVCFGCGMLHPTGSKLRNLVQSDLGQIINFYLCDKCQIPFGNIEYGDHFEQGDLWQRWPENIGREHKDLAGKWGYDQELLTGGNPTTTEK